jgi:hypothetical protein
MIENQKIIRCEGMGEINVEEKEYWLRRCKGNRVKWGRRTKNGIDNKKSSYCGRRG